MKKKLLDTGDRELVEVRQTARSYLVIFESYADQFILGITDGQDLGHWIWC